MDYSVEMRDIRKEYPGVVANDNVNLKVKKGSVLCLVGENGAGKSTLMNILYALEQPTEGEIIINGKEVSFKSSRDAIESRIGMVHQHFMLVHELTVLENIILGMEPKKGISIDFKNAKKDVQELGKRFGMNVPLDMLTGKLSVGMQQKVEILKCLYRGTDILILDEPTAVLTPQETDELFKNIRDLAEDGKSIILITHKLDEVMRIADEIVVMRRGKLVASLDSKDTNAKDLAVHMVGRELPQITNKRQVEQRFILEMDNISVINEAGTYELRDVSLKLNEGEILGVAGVSGNGQGQLAESIAGLIKANSGSIRLFDQDITNLNRKERSDKDISYIPEDRTEVGLCLPWSITENVIAGFHRREDVSTKGMGWLNNENIVEKAKRAIEEFDVRTPSHTTPIGSLSGGNQQKVVIARETMNGAKIIVAQEPTRGVDIGAINFIHNHLVNLRNQGTAVLLISSDLDEVFKLSDRIIVLYEGKIVLTTKPDEISREELGFYMAGVKRGDDDA